MGDTPHVIVFVFAGRQPNMILQTRMMQPVIDTNPNISYDIWNLARTKSDSRYLHQLQPSERTNVRDDFHEVPWRDKLTKVWQHYTHKRYKNCLFVKLDDDIVFLESARFPDYINAIDTNRGSIVSANVINNGACTRTQPALWARYQPQSLLDAHRYQKFAELAHSWFFNNWRDIIGADITIAPTDDWLSINAIGFDHTTLCDIANQIGQPSPQLISGRTFPFGQALGDEGAANMLPRKIMRGFTAAHLTFGPQEITEQQQAHWRSHYDNISRQYLANYATKPIPVL